MRIGQELQTITTIYFEVAIYFEVFRLVVVLEIAPAEVTLWVIGVPLVVVLVIAPAEVALLVIGVP